MSEERKMITIDEALNHSEEFVVDNYIPYAVKRTMIDNIKSVCLVKQDDGSLKLDEGLKTITLEYSFIVQYTNINLSEVSFLDGYDKLKESGLIDKVKNDTIEEYIFIADILDNEIEYEIKQSNSIEGIIKNALNKLIERIPTEKEMSKLIKNLPKALEKINPETLDVLKGVMDKKVQ